MEAAQSAHEKNLSALRKQLDHTKCTSHNLSCTVLPCTALSFLLSHFHPHSLFSAYSESSFPFFFSVLSVCYSYCPISYCYPQQTESLCSLSFINILHLYVRHVHPLPELINRLYSPVNFRIFNIQIRVFTNDPYLYHSSN